MKPTLLQRLKSRLAVSRPGKNQGVAILTVLAIITLMTVLVISFFNMARTAKTTAKGSVEIQRVTTLKDTIINIVIAQFREASRLAPQSASRPREIITWTSQPGAIRTFSATDPSRTKLFKLYSSNQPQIDNIAAFNSAQFLDDVNKDIVADWAIRPDEFTDINRPVYTAATGDRSRATGATAQEGFSYPIADPRRFNGGTGLDDRFRNTEGFTYSSKSIGKVVQGVDPQRAELAMPVRWIYMLQDGTLGFLNETREFTPLNGAGSGDVSRENPVVARLAWWADDESCKVNVNTASVPALWDTPRTTSREDVLLSQRQPIAGEFQRYPGHPATVDLSAVFYPGRRWTPYPDTVPPGGTMAALKIEDAVRIWDVAPFIVGHPRELRQGGSLGSLGGTQATNASTDTAIGNSTDDRIFTSLDEVYFKASGAAGDGMNKPRPNLSTQGTDGQGEFLATLEKSQFFLTHKSHSPELTNQGYPRISMYPMDNRATTELTKPVNSNLSAGVSGYDVTVAANTTIASRPYYFQRDITQAGSRHNEVFVNSGGRNALIFRYLKELSKLPIPGYPEAVPYVLQPALSTADEPTDSQGLSFTSKYPQSWRPGTTQRFQNSSLGGADPMDATERTQILWNMWDYTRSINGNSAFLDSDKYDGGFGQASAICGCRGISGSTGSSHAQALDFNENNFRTPRGAGKRHGAAEICMIVNVAGQKSADGVTTGAWGALAGQLDAKSAAVAAERGSGTRYIVEVGFFVSAFSAKHGWSPQFPEGGIAISTTTRNGEDVRSATSTDAGVPMPMFAQLDGSVTERVSLVRGPADGFLATRTLPPAVVPWGGLNGPRTFFSNGGNAIATCRPFCIRVADSGAGIVVPLETTSEPFRILLLDGASNASNVTQGIDVVLPVGFTNGMRVALDTATGGRTLVSMAQQWAAAANNPNNTGPNRFPPPNTSLRSLVVPHGDYRLTVTPLRVDRDVFVPQITTMVGAGVGVGGQNSHSLYEGTADPRNSSFAGDPPPGAGPGTPAYSLMGSIMDRALVPRYPNPRDTSTNRVFAGLPFGMPHPGQMRLAARSLNPNLSPGDANYRLASRSTVQDPETGLTRQDHFSHGRRDGLPANAPVTPHRGSSDPTETGDFDNGVAAAVDGPYMNYPDEGNRRDYFTNLTNQPVGAIPGQRISPNFLVRSPVDFGSIPTGLQNRVPWQTLRFRPDPLMNDPRWKMRNRNSEPPPGLPFANFCGPKDHFFLDMFWMPVVEPWSISEPFSTKGTINLNQQILPFLYIDRTTALHALLRGERMLAIPNAAAGNYKRPPNFNPDKTYRYFVNAEETVRQFNRRYKEGKDAEGFDMAFNVFRSASEICEMWLVPDKNGNEYDGAGQWNLEYTFRRNGVNSNSNGFWDERLPTGDNSRERPYANLYPRVTVRSNVFKLHLVAQTLQKATSNNPKTFDSVIDSVTAEWRGSCMIERSINPRDPALNNVDYTNLNAASLGNNTPKLDRYYTYRVTEVKQLTQ